jgi:DNA-binding NarL/FixJ family response regulator
MSPGKAAAVVNQTIHLTRVVLADNNAVVRANLHQLLDNAGNIIVVAEASDGQEACTLAGQQKPDVLVLDMNLTAMSGIEVTRWVRSHYSSMGVLILTTHEDEPQAQAVLRAGANGVVLKTASPETIIQAVRAAYKNKSRS